MADTTSMLEDEIIDPVTGEVIDQRELAERSLQQANEQGVNLVGPHSLLSKLTKNVLKTALDAEPSEHLGHDQIVLSLTARVLTTRGDRHLLRRGLWGKGSEDTVSRITEKVTEELAEWASRPLAPGYPVIFVDAIVKSLKPVYTALSEAAAKDRFEGRRVSRGRRAAQDQSPRRSAGGLTESLAGPPCIL